MTGAPAIDLPGPPGLGVAIRYDDDAFVVTDKNLMGRRVAGRDFLDAYLRHGRWDELVALVANPPSEKSIQQLFESHPAGRPRGRRLRVVAQQGFHRAFFPGPPAPCCTSPGRWSCASPGAAARRPGGLRALRADVHDLLAGRRPVDVRDGHRPVRGVRRPDLRSKVALDVVGQVAGTYADYLQDRHGGAPALRPRLVHIPLGVDAEKFRPPTPADAPPAGSSWGSPMTRSWPCSSAAFLPRQGAPVPHVRRARAGGAGRRPEGPPGPLRHAAERDVLKSFQDGGVFAPGVRVTFVDGTSRSWNGRSGTPPTSSPRPTTSRRPSGW